MEHSNLVQRLRKPPPPSKTNGLLGDNPFAFGGGLRNGGLSEAAMNLLRPVFTFDYMGAAEFEFGAVPAAMMSLAEASNKGELTAFGLAIPLKDVPADFRAPKTKKPPKGDAHVFVLCRTDQCEEVSERIKHWASEPWNSGLKETTRLAGTLRPFNEWDGEVQGWLELDNGFMFFSNEEMWKKTCELFGVETDAP